MDIRVVTSGQALEDIRALFREYAAGEESDACFQGFAEEVAGLPGEYVAPRGALLLATIEGTPAGCVGVRLFENDSCEMKRLFVRPEFRGSGCGRRLAEAAICWAQENGYRRMFLDTLPTMTNAQRLYERLGFHDIPAYRHNPVSNTRYMALALAAPNEHRVEI